MWLVVCSYQVDSDAMETASISRYIYGQPARTAHFAGNCSLWAPDVNLVNGEYVLYYSVSSLGSQNSAIGLATSPSMEEGTWTDHGAVITSQPGDIYNASKYRQTAILDVLTMLTLDVLVDPNLIVTPSGLHLGFGSYWDCIFQVPMSDVDTPAAVRQSPRPLMGS